MAGEPLVDSGELTRQADDATERLGVAHDVVSGDGGRAGVGLEQRREDAHRCRLAGAVGAEQAEHRARRHPQVDAVERGHNAERFA